MKQRTHAILIALIDRYVKTARPVGSAALSQAAQLQLSPNRRVSLQLSPATIRAVLQDLESDGYIWQPHTSAGRIPTDQGYRYYVDHIRSRLLGDSELAAMKQELAELRQRYAHLAQATVRLLSTMSHTVAISGSSRGNQNSQIAGLPELFRQLDDGTVETVREISDIVEQLDEALPELDEKADEGPTVFIGQENPFMSAQHTSLIIKRIQTRGRGVLTVIIVGPKRMAYARNISLLNALNHIV